MRLPFLFSKPDFLFFWSFDFAEPSKFKRLSGNFNAFRKFACCGGGLLESGPIVVRVNMKRQLPEFTHFFLTKS